MQRNALNIAVAAALVSLAGAASATTFTPADTAVINMSGSSATNGQLKTWAQTVLCSSDAVTVSFDSNDFAVMCTPKAGFSFSKAHVAVVKNSNGGSGNGISPITAGTTLAFLNPFTNALSTTAIPDIGVSDEEPSLLVAALAASGDVSKLVSSPLNVVTFGTPVTLNLYRALQQAQVATLGAACAGSDSEACMPSLTKGQIASIFTGNAVSWSEFGLTNPSGDNQIYVARRVSTSGTQTGSRVFFLNDPCAANMAKFVTGNDGQANNKADACNAATMAGNVFEASGSGNVETCLTNHDRNGRWAIGINSTEFPAIGTADQSPEYLVGGGAATGAKINNGDHQRHIKLNGVSPSTFNVATNHYSNWVEATMNVSNVRTLSADAAALQGYMVTGFNDPTVLAGLNNAFNTTNLWHGATPTLDAGIVAPVQSGTPATTATVADTHVNPVMYFTHSISGTPTTCQPAMTYYATGLSN